MDGRTMVNTLALQHATWDDAFDLDYRITGQFLEERRKKKYSRCIVIFFLVNSLSIPLYLEIGIPRRSLSLSEFGGDWCTGHVQIDPAEKVSTVRSFMGLCDQQHRIAHSLTGVFGDRIIEVSRV
jgi:hypothetical protein